jgi:hypothetical protein
MWKNTKNCGCSDAPMLRSLRCSDPYTGSAGIGTRACPYVSKEV